MEYICRCITLRLSRALQRSEIYMKEKHMNEKEQHIAFIKSLPELNTTLTKEPRPPLAPTYKQKTWVKVDEMRKGDEYYSGPFNTSFDGACSETNITCIPKKALILGNMPTPCDEGHNVKELTIDMRYHK
jgi:hypothetical protein